MAMDDVKRRLATNLRRLRLAKSLSQEALAHEVGSQRTYISELERAKRNPTIDVVDRLARYFEVKLGDLLD
jgi:transcriptional regulator with XRE-family HTH domain